jgi:hypothetical protein
MPDYRIIIDIKDVTEGDATYVADSIWNNHAADLDAKLGDFAMQVSQVSGSNAYPIDWTPGEM